MTYTFSPLSESAVVIEFGSDINSATHQIIQKVAKHLERNAFSGMIEFVPAYTTLTIYYEPVIVHKALANPEQKDALPYQLVTDWLESALKDIEKDEPNKPKTIYIPVCYGGDYGPDLELVANHHSLTKDEVIQFHTDNEYLIYMMGFAPGFPYIGGMTNEIATPRKESPRLKIPAGSVGIAGNQTGMYPIETPGGWQLIGKTPLRLFRPEQEPPTLLESGDVIRFYAISETEFKQWKDE